MKIIVAFSDDGMDEIIASFAGQPDIKSWPHQGEIDELDDRWKEYCSMFSGGIDLHNQ